MKIKCFNFKYSIEELNRWKKGDKDIVPENVLKWLGPGMVNGLGYKEHLIKKHLEKKGYNVIYNEYNLSTDNTKYRENNMIIKNVIGETNYNRLTKLFRNIESNEVEIISQSDLFVFNENEYMFIEVRKDSNNINPPKQRFAKLIKGELGIEFVIYNLKSEIEEEITEIEID